MGGTLQMHTAQQLDMLRQGHVYQAGGAACDYRRTRVRSRS